MSKLVCVDFDGVVTPFGSILTDLDQPPFPGVSKAVKLLKERGFGIVILTSRLSPYWWNVDYKYFGAPNPEAFGAAQEKYIADYLEKWDIPWDLITCEKVPALVYFDDRAMKISEDYPLLQAVLDWKPIPWRESSD